MSQTYFQKAPATLKHLEAESALALMRSLHADLDLSGIVKRLYTFTCGLTSACHLRYANENPNVSFEHGVEQEHSLSYELRLTSASDPAGQIVISAFEPLGADDREMIEELLSLAANALRNAHQHQKISQPAAMRNGSADKYSDALVLIKIEGLEALRECPDNSTLADQVMKELESRLAHELRDADGTMQIDNDHLAVLLPCTATIGANRVAEKVRQLVTHLDFIDPAVRATLGVRFGISSTEEAGSAEAVIAHAKVQLSSTLGSDEVLH